MRHAPLALLLLVLLPACGGSQHEYPDEVADNFLHACTATGASEKECSCSLGELQERYSAEEYSTLEQKVKRGDEAATQELGKVAEGCKQ